MPPRSRRRVAWSSERLPVCGPDHAARPAGTGSSAAAAAVRNCSAYLGEDEARWDDRFRHYLHDDPAHTGNVWLRMPPDSLVAQDLSYSV